MLKCKAALRAAKRLSFCDQLIVLGDRGIDADVLLEGGEIEKGSLVLERRHVAADGSDCSRNPRLDLLLDLLQSFSHFDWLRREVLIVRLEEHGTSRRRTR